MKVLSLAFAVIGLGLVACGSSGGFDEAACTDAQDTYNQAIEDCTGTAGAADFACSTYADAAASYSGCDFTAYYTAWADSISCDTTTNTINFGTTPTLDCGG